MTELKTLKDIYFDKAFRKYHKLRKGEAIPTKLITQEAIKWIKERKFLPVPKGVIPATHHAYMHGEREFIKHFFNLTEEDLGGKK